MNNSLVVVWSSENVHLPFLQYAFSPLIINMKFLLQYLKYMFLSFQAHYLLLLRPFPLIHHVSKAEYQSVL